MAALVEDEISLYDLYAVLVRRRWLVAGIVLSSLIVGSLYAFSRTPEFEYRAVLDIARVSTDAGPKPVESPESVVARVDYGNQPVRASVAGEMVILRATGPQTGRLIEAIHSVANRISESHETLASSVGGLTSTQLIGAPTRSGPTGTPTGVLIVLSALLGSMLGIMTAFAAEFLVHAHRQLRAEAQ